MPEKLTTKVLLASWKGLKAFVGDLRKRKKTGERLATRVVRKIDSYKFPISDARNHNPALTYKSVSSFHEYLNNILQEEMTQPFVDVLTIMGEACSVYQFRLEETLLHRIDTNIVPTGQLETYKTIVRPLQQAIMDGRAKLQRIAQG